MATGNVIWTNWCDTSSSTNSVTCSGDVWTAWTSVTTSDCTSNAVWYGWNGEWTPIVLREQTPEEREASRVQMEAARVEQERKWVEREAAQRAAKEKAEALLQENLTELQRAELEAHRYFTVESRQSKRRYRVKADKGCHGNIAELDEAGREVASLCAAPIGGVPEGDYLLSQALFLEHAEADFLRAANRRALT